MILGLKNINMTAWIVFRMKMRLSFIKIQREGVLLIWCADMETYFQYMYLLYFCIYLSKFLSKMSLGLSLNCP